MRKPSSSLAVVLALMATTALVSCKTTDGPLGNAVNSMSGMREQREARMATAANVAMEEGRTADALAKYESLYKNNTTNPEVVLNYAQLLRKTGKAEKAIEVLQPMLRTNRGRVADDRPLLFNEFAAAQIALGHFDEAEETLNHVLEDQTAVSAHHDAYNLMGIVLDAKGKHIEAEQMFRMALDGWKGDATSVTNNLALSLANQGKFDESLTLLRQALVVSPNKTEVAKNIQIVSSLRDKVIPPAPTNIKADMKKK